MSTFESAAFLAFRDHVRFYVLEKTSIRSGIMTWYDWQLYSIFADMFDSFGSLW